MENGVRPLPGSQGDPCPKLCPTDRLPLLCDLVQAPYPLWAYFYDHIGLLHAILLEKSLLKKEVLGFVNQLPSLGAKIPLEDAKALVPIHCCFFN